MIKSGLSQAVNIFALPFAGGISSSSTDILQTTALLFAFNVVFCHITKSTFWTPACFTQIQDYLQ